VRRFFFREAAFSKIAIYNEDNKDDPRTTGIQKNEDENSTKKEP
jgi:hypothetical protein